ncbi:hypothetical protein CsatB_009150 [Cannabis sativa]
MKLNEAIQENDEVFLIFEYMSLDTTALRMQTTTFEKFKGLWKTLTEGTWSYAFDGLGMSLLLTWNPAFQVCAVSKSVATFLTYPAIRCKVTIQAGDPNDDDGGGAQVIYHNPHDWCISV